MATSSEEMTLSGRFGGRVLVLIVQNQRSFEKHSSRSVAREKRSPGSHLGLYLGCIVPVPRSEHGAIRLRDEGTPVKSWYLEKGLGTER